MPVAVLIKFPAGSFQGSGPDRSPLFLLRATVVAESHCEVDIFDGDECGIETTNGFEAFSRGPKRTVRDPVFGEVGHDHHGTGDNAERPAFWNDEGSAADDGAFQFFQNDPQELRVQLAVRIDGDDDLSRGRGASSITDFGKVLGVFVRNHGAEFSRDLFRAVGAAIEDDHGLDVTRANFGCRRYCRESSGQVFLLVVSRDDDGDFHS